MAADSELGQLVATVSAQVSTRCAGADADVIERLVSHGEPALHAALLADHASRAEGTDGTIPFRTVSENWNEVFAEFCRRMPKTVAEFIENPRDSRYDTGALIWVLGCHPSVEVVPLFLRLLNHSDRWYREFALTGLLKLRHEPAIPHIMDFLDRNYREREISVILDCMFYWPALRQARAIPALRLAAEFHRREFAGIAASAAELAEVILTGKEPVARQAWQDSVSRFSRDRN